MNNQRNPLQIPSRLYSDHVITLAIVAIMIRWVSLFFCLTQLTTRTAPLLGISIMSLSILMHSNGDMLNRCQRRLIHCLTTFLLKSLTKKFTFFSIRGGKFGSCHVYVASWPVERWPHGTVVYCITHSVIHSWSDLTITKIKYLSPPNHLLITTNSIKTGNCSSVFYWSWLSLFFLILVV